VGLLKKAKNIQQNSWSGEATLRCARVFDLDVFEVVDCFKFHEFSKFRDADIWFYPKNHSLTDCGQLCVLSLVFCVPNVLWMCLKPSRICLTFRILLSVESGPLKILGIKWGEASSLPTKEKLTRKEKKNTTAVLLLVLFGSIERVLLSTILVLVLSTLVVLVRDRTV